MHDPSHNVRFVLVHTSHPGNIGSAARAIRTMGFRRLVLVGPERYPDPRVEALAAGADDVLAGLVLADTVDAALADCHLVLGLSARRRGVTLPEYTPRQAAAALREAVGQGREVALVFGNERVGLHNDELARCHGMVRIPSVDDFSSLNLAQAVQVQAYEARLALLDAPPPPPEPRDPPADHAQMEQFFAHLAQTLDDIDFHKGRSPVTIELRLRKLFSRARPDQRELRVLHGVLAEAQRAARLGASVGRNEEVPADPPPEQDDGDGA
ncbi:MAG TPA: RNA methyltransferase [Rhodanobacteraceae bacterium]|nr:RNA methyltransferase [Rhodanobacteraceae bacterium]